MTTTDYLLCGLRLRSALSLPSLLPWPGDDMRAPDIVVSQGPIPELPEPAAIRGEYLTVAADGAVLMNLPGVARICTRGGREIIVEIAPDATDDGWRAYVLGSALAHLCHQRGLLPLHAATVRIGSRTVAIAGTSGAGKSTLALALNQRGHALLSDDVTVLRVSPGAPPIALPAFPRLKLWRDALDAHGVDPAPLKRVRAELEKYDLPPGEDFDAAPRPLDAVLFLEEGGEPALRPITTLETVPRLEVNVSRRKVGLLLGRKAELFAQCAAASSALRAFVFSRPKDFSTLASGAALIEESLAV